MSLCALQGFLFAMANAPEEVPVQDWIAVPAAAGLSDAGDVGTDIAALYETIRAQTRARRAELPDNIQVHESAMDNGLADNDLHEWSRGFMVGHTWLQKIWQAHLPAELVGNLGAAMMVLGFFGSERLAARLLAERSNAGDLASLAATMLSSLPGAMAEYVNISRSIAEVLADPSLDQTPQS